MRFTLEVGDRERHSVEFAFNQLLGQSMVKVDGRPVFTKKRWFSEPVVASFDLDFGTRERIHLRIEKERKHLFASKYKVYIDNRLTQLYQGI